MDNQTHTFPLTEDYVPRVGDVITRNNAETMEITRVESCDTVLCLYGSAASEIRIDDFHRKVTATVADAAEYGRTLTVTRKDHAPEIAFPAPVLCPHCGQAMPKIEVQK